MHEQIEKIYKDHYPLLYSLAAKVLVRHEDREEVIHDVFLAFWDKQHELGAIDSIKSYLCKSVVNRSLNMIKRSDMLQRNHKVILATSAASYEDHKVETKEKIQIVRDEIDKLPPQCKEVFRLSRYEEMSQQEIADRLNISIKTVKNHVGKALKILHENLSTHDYFNLILLGVSMISYFFQTTIGLYDL